MNILTVWHGFTVNGDSSELDRIIVTPNIISLGKNEIIGVLSCNGEHRIVIGGGADCRSEVDASLSPISGILIKR